MTQRTASIETALDDLAIFAGRSLVGGLLANQQLFNCFVEALVTISHDSGESDERLLQRFTPGFPGRSHAERHLRWLKEDR